MVCLLAFRLEYMVIIDCLVDPTPIQPALRIGPVPMKHRHHSSQTSFTKLNSPTRSDFSTHPTPSRSVSFAPNTLSYPVQASAYLTTIWPCCLTAKGQRMRQ